MGEDAFGDEGGGGGEGGLALVVHCGVFGGGREGRSASLSPAGWPI